MLDDRGNEFPRINGRHGGQAYRYIYTAHWGDDVAFGPAMKHDVQRATTEVHDYLVASRSTPALSKNWSA